MERASMSPFTLNILAGGGAGLIETTITYPLDVMRTRIQMIRGTSSPGIMTVWRSILKEKTIFRGLLPPLISEVPRRALKFTANDFYGRKLATLSPRQSQVVQMTLAGILTGCTETVMHSPFEKVKIRLQAVEFSHFRNSWDCAYQILRQEGVLGFYQGFEAYLWRQAVWNGVFFGSISFFKEWDFWGSEEQSLLDKFCQGLVAGSIATCLNTPLDVAKTRIQCMDVKGGRHHHQTPWCLPFLYSIQRSEGLGACFRGLDVRLYRAAPGSGILLVAYESICQLIIKSKEKKAM